MSDRFGSAGNVRWIGPPEEWLGEAHAALSLRSGGRSAPPFDTLNLGHSAGDDLGQVAENERIWIEARGLPGPPARAKLAHGTRGLYVERPGVYGPYDALLTDKAGLPLWLTVADCCPIFFAAGPWLALLHCGWRGAADGAAGITARALGASSGVPLTDVRAWIGPGIGSCCYQVGEEVAVRFAPERVQSIRGELHLDLGASIADDLRASGLLPARIGRSSYCTSCNPDLFFSYRRDGARSGRMAAVLWR
jgi:YfiH family protein